MKLKSGDTVQVITGKDKGRQGKVTKVFAKEDRVIVEGINKYKRHIKRQSESQPGQILELERPIATNKIQLVSADGKTITRIGYQVTKSGEKIRIDRKTGKAIDKK